MTEYEEKRGGDSNDVREKGEAVGCSTLTTVICLRRLASIGSIMEVIAVHDPMATSWPNKTAHWRGFLMHIMIGTMDTCVTPHHVVGPRSLCGWNPILFMGPRSIYPQIIYLE